MLGEADRISQASPRQQTQNLTRKSALTSQGHDLLERYWTLHFDPATGGIKSGTDRMWIMKAGPQRRASAALQLPRRLPNDNRWRSAADGDNRRDPGRDRHPSVSHYSHPFLIEPQ